MRILVTWGSKRGGTEGIARTIAQQLRGDGFEVETLPTREVADLAGFDAVVIGGALYANRWHRDARRFVRRRAEALRRVPVWLFSSGPLDNSAEQRDIQPVRDVKIFLRWVGAQGHVTFGGRLEPTARGFPASAMAKRHAGDWRRPERIRAWAWEIARALPSARPRPATIPPGHSVVRLGVHAIAGWATCAAFMSLLLRMTTTGAAIAIHAIVAPIVFWMVAAHYFSRGGAREPFLTASTFALATVALDLIVVAGLSQHSLAIARSIVVLWIPVASIFLVTWATGTVAAMVPSRSDTVHA
jgi:menaquinone-dependent protoporphyrinogen oxidase